MIRFATIVGLLLGLVACAASPGQGPVYNPQPGYRGRYPAGPVSNYNPYSLPGNYGGYTPY